MRRALQGTNEDKGLKQKGKEENKKRKQTKQRTAPAQSQYANRIPGPSPG